MNEWEFWNIATLNLRNKEQKSDLTIKLINFHYKKINKIIKLHLNNKYQKERRDSLLPSFFIVLFWVNTKTKNWEGFEEKSINHKKIKDNK